MTLNKQDEAELVEIFRKQEKMTSKTPEYLANRDIIMNKVLQKLKPSINACLRFWNQKYHVDLAEGESLIYYNLLYAIDAFKPSKGKCKFNSFFWTVNSELFKNYLSKVYAQKRMPRHKDITTNKVVFSPTLSLSATMDVDNDKDDMEKPDFMGSITDNNDLERDTHCKLLFEKIMKDATPKQRRILESLYSQKTYKEIGRPLNMTPSDVCNVLKQIRRKYNTEQL